MQNVDVHDGYSFPVNPTVPIVHGNTVSPVVIAYLFDAVVADGLIVMPDIYLPIAGRYNISIELWSRTWPTRCMSFSFNSAFG